MVDVKWRMQKIGPNVDGKYAVPTPDVRSRKKITRENGDAGNRMCSGCDTVSSLDGPRYSPQRGRVGDEIYQCRKLCGWSGIVDRTISS